MLKIINDLSPFFEDCYRRINVREYAKLTHITPPTSSKMLNYYVKEGLLLKTAYRNNLLFYANKDSKVFIDLSRIYWRQKLKELTAYIEEHLMSPAIVLFGSLSKAEAKNDSDIDLAIFASERKLDIKSFENKLKRKIQIYWFEGLAKAKSRELASNIANGYVLSGRLRT